MEHPPSKRVKLFNDSYKTIEDSIKENASYGNSQGLLDMNRYEFTQNLGCFIDSALEEKTTDGKIISSNPAEAERFICHEYGFEKYSTNCEAHYSELMLSVQRKSHIKKVKYPTSQCVLIPDGAGEKTETELMLFGHKTHFQDDKFPSKTTMKPDKFLNKSVNFSDITIAKDVKTQKGICSKSDCCLYRFNNILTCELIRSEDTNTSGICVESIRVGQSQDPQRKISNIKQEDQKFREKIPLNAIIIKPSRNATLNNKESTLGIAFALKDSEIQKESKMISQTETPASNLETDVNPLNVRSSCLINGSTSACNLDAQKGVVRCLEYASSKYSNGLFVEKTPVKKENKKNVIYTCDDTTIDKESGKIQIYDSKGTCSVLEMAQRIDNPLAINTFIGTCGNLNFKCDSVDFSKIMRELIHGRTTNVNKNKQTVYKTQCDKAPLIIQLQLPEKKRGNLNKMPKMSNCKDGYICEIICSNEKESLGCSQLETKLEIVETTSMPQQKKISKDNESFCDALQDLSHNSETQDLMWLNVAFTLNDAVDSGGVECQPGSLHINSFEACSQISKGISGNKLSGNTKGCHVESDRNASSGNKGECESIDVPKSDLPFMESNDGESLSEHNADNLIQIECASKIEKSRFNASVNDHVDCAGVNDILSSCEVEKSKDICVIEIPSTFAVNNNVLKSSGSSNIISENLNKDPSDSFVACTKVFGSYISERETEYQMKHLCNPQYVQDSDCDFQTKNATTYSNTESTYGVQSDWTSTLEQFCNFGSLVADCVQLSTHGNTLQHSQKPRKLGEHHIHRVNSNNKITFCHAKNMNIQASVSCNLLKNTEVNHFSLKDGECHLKYVTSCIYPQGTDSQRQNGAANLIEVTRCLQGDKKQSLDTESSNYNILSFTVSVPLGHNRKKICENQSTSALLNINNSSEETTISFSVKTGTQTSPEYSEEIGLPNLDDNCRTHFKSSILDMPTKTNIPLNMVETNAHFNHGEGVFDECHCTKELTSTSTTKKSTAVKIAAGISKNKSAEASFFYNKTNVVETNTCSENKAECHLNCLAQPELLKNFTGNMGIVAGNECHPVSSLEDDIKKECGKESAKFSNVCSLTRDNISWTNTPNISLEHQNKLVDEHLASPTAVQSFKNNSEETKIVFTEDSDVQSPSLMSYTSRMNNISKKEIECLQKYECTSSSNHIKDNDLLEKTNVLYTAPYFNTENIHGSETDYSCNEGQVSFYINSSKDTVSLSSPESLSPLRHVNEILEEHQNGTTLNMNLDAKTTTEENAMAFGLKFANFQTSVTCDAMIENMTVNNSSKHYTDPVNSESCFINHRNDVATDLVDVFQETPEFEHCKMYLTEIKCTDKAIQNFNTCNSFKDCSGLNRIINTSQHFEMIGDLVGCNSNNAATFSFDPSLKVKTGFPPIDSEVNTELVQFVQEERKHPRIKNNSFSKTTVSAFDSFEKIILTTDSEEDTVTLIREINLCNKEGRNVDASIIKEIIHDNDKPARASSPQISTFKSTSVKGCQRNINNSNCVETKNEILCEQDEKEHSQLELPVMLQNRTNKNNMHNIQISLSSLEKYEIDCAPDRLQQHIIGHKQLYTKPMMDENNEDRQELSSDIVSRTQNDQQVVLLQSSKQFALIDRVTGKMDQKEQKQKTSGMICEMISMGVEGAEETSHRNDIPASGVYNLVKDVKPLQLKSKQEFKQDISTPTTHNSLIYQRKSVNYSHIEESSEYEISTCRKSQGSLEYQKQRTDSTIGCDYFENINSNKGSTITSVEEQHLKNQFLISKDEIPNFEMKEQFSAVLKELFLFHEISKQSEWSESISGENETEIVNKKNDLVILPEKSDKINNLHEDKMHDNLQSSDHPLEKAGLNQKEHECLRGNETLQDTFPSFAKTMPLVKGEQEVPMEIDASEIDDEESLYSPCKVLEYRSQSSREDKAWSSAFSYQMNNKRTSFDGIDSKTDDISNCGCTFISCSESYLSNGLLRIEPLKTCSGPIRIGLSKRIKAKHLHPYLR
ncbi:uncharacterized protein [Narcine bancroftii]|uniref:uncharacterized protein isoform X2 n=1 Tax=Narcine bancroftii TaxID=1343680 RepID=UPI0038316FB1